MKKTHIDPIKGHWLKEMAANTVQSNVTVSFERQAKGLQHQCG